MNRFLTALEFILFAWAIVIFCSSCGRDTAKPNLKAITDAMQAEAELCRVGETVQLCD